MWWPYLFMVQCNTPFYKWFSKTANKSKCTGLDGSSVLKEVGVLCDIHLITRD